MTNKNNNPLDRKTKAGVSPASFNSKKLSDEIKEIKHKKNWACSVCNKQYCFVKCAINHRKSKGKETHIKFKQLI